MSKSNQCIPMPSCIECDTKLKPIVRILMARILSETNENMKCRSTNRHLASKIGVSDRSIIRHLQSLEQEGYIKIDHKRSVNGKKIIDREINVTKKVVLPQSLAEMFNGSGVTDSVNRGDKVSKSGCQSGLIGVTDSVNRGDSVVIHTTSSSNIIDKDPIYELYNSFVKDQDWVNGFCSSRYVTKEWFINQLKKFSKDSFDKTFKDLNHYKNSFRLWFDRQDNSRGRSKPKSNLIDAKTLEEHLDIMGYLHPQIIKYNNAFNSDDWEWWLNCLKRNGSTARSRFKSAIRKMLSGEYRGNLKTSIYKEFNG